MGGRNCPAAMSFRASQMACGTVRGRNPVPKKRDNDNGYGAQTGEGIGWGCDNRDKEEFEDGRGGAYPQRNSRAARALR